MLLIYTDFHFTVPQTCVCQVYYWYIYAYHYLQQAAYSQRNIFWKTVSDLLFREKVLSILLKPPKKKQLPAPRIYGVDHEVDRDIAEAAMPSPEEFHQLHSSWRAKFSSKNLFHFQSVEVERVKDHEGTLTEAIEIANKLFANVDTKKKGFLEREDFLPFFRVSTAAETAFVVFDRNKDNKVQLEVK